jgi:hypothetical protein
MWMLSLIPDSYLHLAILAILFTGIGLFVISLILNFIPTIRDYRELVRIIGMLLIIGGVYSYGGYETEMSWRAKMEQAKTVVEQKQLDAKRATVRIQKVYITRQKIVHDTKIVIQERIREVEKRIDAECKIDPAVIEIHNQAARNPLEGKK